MQDMRTKKKKKKHQEKTGTVLLYSKCRKVTQPLKTLNYVWAADREKLVFGGEFPTTFIQIMEWSAATNVTHFLILPYFPHPTQKVSLFGDNDIWK